VGEVGGVNILPNSGECFGLVCVNNSGKTSLLDVLVDIQAPTGGSTYTPVLSLSAPPARVAAGPRIRARRCQRVVDAVAHRGRVPGPHGPSAGHRLETLGGRHPHGAYGETSGRTDDREVQTTTGLSRVTFYAEENFLLKPGESVQEFCARKMEPDRSPTLPNGTWPTTALFNASRNHIQLRPVICVFDAKYWRLQEPYLHTLLPMYYCSAIVVYGYATYLDGSIVWKYPTAVPYLQALLNMTNRRQLSDHNNNITVYFTLGGEREDSINLSFVAGHPVIRHVVRCSGDQLVTADVFNRALGMLPKMEDQFRLGFIISVAPETFLAPAAQLGAPVLGTMQWDNHTRQPGRTSYASMCQEKPTIRTSMHPLCLMVAAK
ncbi:hypothetical protein MRX96_044891, partial [Rhipicephalus microplus]